MGCISFRGKEYSDQEQQNVKSSVYNKTINNNNYVLGKYLIRKEQRWNQVNYNASHIRAAENFVVLMRNALPGISIDLYSSVDKQAQINKYGYIDESGIHINVDNFTMDVPIHEMSHIFQYIMDINPDLKHSKTAINNLIDRSINNKDKYYYAAKDKWHDNVAGLRSEIGAMILTKEITQGEVITFWDKVKNFIMRIFGQYKEDQDLTDLKTINNLLDKFMHDLRNGNVISNITDIQVQRFMEANDIGVHEFTKPLTRPEKIGDMHKVLMNNTDHDQKLREQGVQEIYDRIFNQLGTSNFKFVDEIAGRAFNIDVTVKESNDVVVSKLIDYAHEIYEARLKKNIDNRGTLINILNNSSNIPVVNNYTGYDEETIARMQIFLGMGFIGTRQSNEILTLGALKARFNHLLSGLEESYIDDNSLVVLHSVKLKEGVAVSIDISLLQVHLNSVTGDNPEYNGKYLFSKIFDESQWKQKAYGLDIPAGYVNALSVGLTLQAMRLKQINPKINLRRVGILEAIPGNTYPQYYAVDTMSMVKRMKKLFQINTLQPEEKKILQFFPEDVETLLKDQAIYDVNYDVNPLNTLQTFILSNKELLEDMKKHSDILNHSYEEIQNFLVDPGNRDRLRGYLEVQYNYIKHLNEDEGDQKGKLDEYLATIAASLNYLDVKYLKKNSKKGSILEHWTVSADDFSDDLVQQFNTVADRAFVYSQGLALQRETKFREVLNAYMKANGYTAQFLKNKPLNIFARVMVFYGEHGLNKIYDDKGNEVKDFKGRQLWTGKVITDINSEIAIKKGLKKEDIALGKFLADEMQELVRMRFVEELKHDNQYRKRDKDGNTYYDMELLNKKVDLKMIDSWEYGDCVIMSASNQEKIFTGRYGKVWKRFFDKAVGGENVRTENIKLIEENTNGRLPSFFSQQINNKMTRAGLLGIYGEPKNKYFSSTQRFGDLFDVSHDLERTYKYMLADTFFKIEAEEKVIPFYERAKLISTDENMKTGKNKSHTLRSLESLYTKYVEGKQDTLSKKDSKLASGESFFRGLMAIRGFLSISLSATIGIVSFTANEVGIVTGSLANQWAGDPVDMPTIGEFEAAIPFILSNIKLTERLMAEHQIWDRDRYTWLNSPRYQRVAKNIYHKYYMMLPNWGTDYFDRARTMVAMLKHQGILSAYTLKNDELVYNVKKDKRFYGEDGKQSPEQKFLADKYVEMLLADKRYTERQKLNAEPVAPWVFEDTRKVKAIVREFIIGGYGQTEEVPGSSLLPVQMIMQFKKFFVDFYNHRMISEREVDALGKFVIAYNEDGIMKLERERYLKEGTWRMTAKLLRDASFIKPILSMFGLACKYNPNSPSWKRMSKKQKLAVLSAAMDLTACLLGVILYAMIRGMADKDKRKQDIGYSDMKIIRSVVDGFTTALSMTPFAIEKLIGTDGAFIPVFSMLSSFFRIITGHGNDPTIHKNYDYEQFILGYSGTIRPAEQVFDKINE